ncbi:nucleoside-diphosphate kinase [Catellatospora methionotrophica]|uniref:nucleoside-diphosphate kinase n=1 Tax=Catellatospora methionotrophica TaxID=121620 RepID=UPI0033EF0147
MTTVPWPVLSRLPEKIEFYRHDVYLREALAELTARYGDGLPEVLWRSTLMIVRPEGLRSGRLPAVLEFLDRHGYTVVGARAVAFDRFQAREMWRYQHTLASIDRLAVTDRILIGNPALVLLLRARTPGDLPASVALCTLKGPADPAHRQPDTLRSLLDQPNLMFSLVHCADEPADLVRELGIMFDSPARQELIGALDRDSLDTAGQTELDAALAATPVAFTLDDTLARVRAVLHGTAAAPMLDALTSGSHNAWRPLAREVDRTASRVDPIDLAFIGTCFITYDEPGARKLLGGPDVAAWRHT